MAETDEELLERARAARAYYLSGDADPGAAQPPAPPPMVPDAEAIPVAGSEPIAPPVQTWGGARTVPEVFADGNTNAGPEITIPEVQIGAPAAPGGGAQTTQEVVVEGSPFADEPDEAMAGRPPYVARAGAIGTSPKPDLVEVPGVVVTDDASMRISEPDRYDPPRDSAHAARRYFETFLDEKSHLARQANAEADQASWVASDLEAAAAVKRKAAEEGERAAKIRTRENEAALNKMRETLDAIKQQKVDIRPLLSDAGFQFASVLAATLGGFAQGIGATKSNLGLDTLQNVINRELDVQAKNIELGQAVAGREMNLLEQQMRVFNDTEAARTAAKLQLLEALDTQMQAHFTRAGIPIAQAQRAREMVGMDRLKAGGEQQLQHQLEEAARRARLAAAGAAQARLDKEREYQLKLRKLELEERGEAADSAKKRAEAAVMSGEGGSGFIGVKPMDSKQAASLGAKDGAIVVRGFVPLGGTKGEAQQAQMKELRQSAAAIQEIDRIVQDSIELRKKLRGRTGMVGMGYERATDVGPFASADLAQLRANEARLVELHFKVGGYGTPQKHELELAKDAIGNLTSVSPATDKKLAAWANSRRKHFESTVRAANAQEAYVVQRPGQPPRIVPTGRPFSLPQVDYEASPNEKVEGLAPPPALDTQEREMGGKK